jgi:quercetin dioxygenase-like cupin family protein
LVLQAGQTLPSHAIRGESTLLCIEGAAKVTVDGTACLLRPHQFVLLPAQAVQTLRAVEDTSLLWTI